MHRQADVHEDVVEDLGEVRRVQVERAYAKLSEDHRMILALRVDADLSYAAIAEALAVPVGTVMSRLARARESLIEALHESREAEPR